MRITVICLLLISTYAAAQQKAILTRIDIKQSDAQNTRRLLLQYAASAAAHPQNIMAEAYYEEENPLIMWMIERWNNAHAQKQLVIPNAQLTTIHIKDLEPLAAKAWKRSAATQDTPLTIMLFVDSKPGTEQQFMEVYHTAMPQFRGEPGVINYQLSRLEKDSTQFVTYEKFRSEAAFQYHLNFPPIQPVIDYLHTSIKSQPFQQGLHRLIPLWFFKNGCGAR